MRKTGVIHELAKNRMLYAMTLPAVLFFLAMSYLPMAGMVVAFKNYRFDKGLFGSEWSGLENFKFFFLSGKAWEITQNTLFYNALFIVSGLLLQMAIAIVIAELGGKYLKKMIQTSMLLPYFISWVIVGTMAYNLLNYEVGFINSLLGALGMKPVDFYGSPGYWPYILTFFNNWKGVGFGSLIYLAVIVGIDSHLHEAAQIDGANVLQRIRYIILPLLLPTTIILLLLAVGQIFRGNFDLFYQLIGNNGLLFAKTDVIDTYVFRSLIRSNDIGMSAAAGFFQSVLCFAVIMIMNHVVKKIYPDYSLF